MERSIIDYLFAPDSGIQGKIRNNENYAEYQILADKNYKKLEKTLNEEQKEILNKLVYCYSDAEFVSNGFYFKEGVKLGVRFVCESMSE